MSIKVYVISDIEKDIRVEDEKIVEILGGKEESLAVQIGELFDSVVDSMIKDRSTDGELTIELTGSISLKGGGNAKLLFFNAGGDATKTDVMKVTFKTKISSNSPA